MVDHLVLAGRGAPAVVVVHDRYGVLPHVMDTCAALAEAGLTAVAVDLYDGASTTDEDEAERLMDALDREVATHRLAAAVRDLRRAEVLAPRISALGYGMGGELALSAAAAGLFDAVVAYGASLGPGAAPLPCPVQLHPAGTAAAKAWESTVQFLGGRRG